MEDTAASTPLRANRRHVNLWLTDAEKKRTRIHAIDREITTEAAAVEIFRLGLRLLEREPEAISA